MKINELPSDAVLDSVAIRIPEDTLEAFKDYAGGEPVMYVGGNVMGAFMMTPDPPGSEERRLYPLPPSVSTSDILEWEIANE